MRPRQYNRLSLLSILKTLNHCKTFILLRPFSSEASSLKKACTSTDRTLPCSIAPTEQFIMAIECVGPIREADKSCDSSTARGDGRIGASQPEAGCPPFNPVTPPRLVRDRLAVIGTLVAPSKTALHVIWMAPQPGRTRLALALSLVPGP
jgi:hypothetical protein